MTILVTGGSGFLGTRVVELLAQQGENVRIFSRAPTAPHDLANIETLPGDICSPRDVQAAVDGMETIHHTAASVGHAGTRAQYWQTNVEGTKNLIDAACDAGVKRLIYTSTPSVIGYGSDVCGVDNAPYPKKWENNYSASKAAAERLVLGANGRVSGIGTKLATVALRPHIVFGPRDSQIMPRIIERARSGALKIVGTGRNIVDTTYIDNAAWAQLDAQSALTHANVACAGRAYFISNGEPVNLWSWINSMLGQLDLPIAVRKVPLKLAWTAGALHDMRALVGKTKQEAPMSRFLALALGRSHWYSMRSAEADLGYHVRVPMAVANEKTVEWFRGELGR